MRVFLKFHSVLLGVGLMASCAPAGRVTAGDGDGAVDLGSDRGQRDATPPLSDAAPPPPQDAAPPPRDAAPPTEPPIDAMIAPDDPCAGRSDGSYCGTALGAGADHNAAYSCAGGQTVGVEPCALGCEEGACRVADADPCASAPVNGVYCGSALAGGDPSRLYTCVAGATAEVQPCELGCQLTPPGSPDTCRRPDDPCAGQANGAYCGARLGAPAGSLYVCRDGATVQAEPCPNGCDEQPVGTPDRCAMGADPCASQNAGNGQYCGRTLGAGQPDTLYLCRDRRTERAEPCADGCESMPAGVDDACRAGDDPCQAANAGNGLYCGRTLGRGDADTLYNCQNGTTANREACPGGCVEMPAGTPDACGAVDDPCQPAAQNGLYCGSSLGTGEADTLYTCQNNRVAASTPCANGCQQNPPGVPDACRRGAAECCLDAPPGVLTQRFSACGAGGQHYGRDYGTPVGTPIQAGMAGTVVSSRLGLPNCYNNGCSQACWNAFNYVKILADCGDPENPAHDFAIYYLHIDDLAPGIADGSHVEQGQLLAFAGNSGCSSGPHIHIETVSVPRGQPTRLNTCASDDPSDHYCDQ